MSEQIADNSDRIDRLAGLISEHQRDLYLYIWSLVHRPDDVQDVLQETNLALWRDMERVSRVSDFRSWACRVAYNQVLAYRKRRMRDRLFFDDALLANLAKESQRLDDRESNYSFALRCCAKKLPPKSRRMLVLRYQSPCSVRAIAEQQNCSAAAVSQALYRIRALLLKCISEIMSQRESESRERQ